jgi:hypothetical protein
LANLNNLNKENIITVDIKNASISTQGNMTFYVTDIKTCNIYCQLVINRSKSNLIKKFAPIENAIDYKVILRAVDPNKSGIKELEFTLLNQIEAFFMVELTDEFISCAGDYKCELFVECKVNGVLERITTSPFTYKVNGSIIDELFKDDNDSSGGNSGGGVTPSLIENLATKQYVNEQITDIPNTDLLVTFTSRHIDDAISSYDDEIIKQDFASRDFVNSMITSVKNEIEDANYATESYVNDRMSSFNTEIGNLLTSSYAPLAYVDDEIVKLSNGIASLNHVTESEMTIAINSALYEFEMSDKFARKTELETTNGKINHVDSKLTELEKDVDSEISGMNERMATFSSTIYYVSQDIDDIRNNYASKEYVATEIANAQLGGGEGGSVDLTGYATTEYVDNAINNIEIPEVDLTDYATKEELNNALGDIESLLGEI